MRALLDINVLLGLLDPDHAHHELAHEWARDGLTPGWASCALTQNGFVRVISQGAYPGDFSVPQAVAALRRATADPRHEFFPCDIELTSPTIIADGILSPRQITYTYLLALAVSRDATFVTFDTGIDRTVVAGADDRHLTVLRP